MTQIDFLPSVPSVVETEGFGCAAAEFRIEKVRAESVLPWGKVAVSYDVMGTLPEDVDTYAAWISVSNRALGIAQIVESLSGGPAQGTLAGTRRLVDAAGGPQLKAAQWRLSRPGIWNRAPSCGVLVGITLRERWALC